MRKLDPQDSSAYYKQYKNTLQIYAIKTTFAFLNMFYSSGYTAEIAYINYYF